MGERPLHKLPRDERPRERLLRLGPEQLTDIELLAILLRTGTKGRSVIELARDLLHHCDSKTPGDGLASLLHMDVADLESAVSGMGKAKVCQVLAALQLGQRAGSSRLSRISVHNPRAVYEYLSPRVARLRQEHFLVLLLTAKNQIIDVESVTVGTLTASLVHPREVFSSAIRRSAHAMILAHNHPSGDPTPSREDCEVTRRLIAAGKLIGIEVLDHLIIGDGRYVSIRERGLVEWS